MSSNLFVVEHKYPEQADFDIFSSFRYDPNLPSMTLQHPGSYPEPLDSPYYLLAYHQERIIAAARHFNWQDVFENGPMWMNGDVKTLDRFLNWRVPDKTRPWRLKLSLQRNGHAFCEFSETGPMDLVNFLTPDLHKSTDSTVWRVLVDTERTEPSGFTTHKTTDRENYTLAQSRGNVSPGAKPEEILMVNMEGEIMEGTITTPYFRRGDAWVTPPLTCGGNAGTTRRYALEQGFCVEQKVKASELMDGEECWLSNGVRGFMRGRVSLNPSQ
ncbi:Aminotransferase class IV [Penicillium odoratum]|uniref:Aminotransferase class IV n=1 Tax=Penicillium odoratum TaxID=1167516 RepID=UPI002549257F|nr:Aminotransferase class IV [Penicillium odoratum]KAJ5760430.1 Aminotransferase class IV [Penicillium odoratum]